MRAQATGGTVGRGPRVSGVLVGAALVAAVSVGAAMMGVGRGQPSGRGGAGGDEAKVSGGVMERERGFIFKSISEGGREYPYTVYVPRAYTGDEPMPMVLFLHGRGECGTDGSRQIYVGLGEKLMWDPERWPFIVIMPQKPDYDSLWPDHERALMAMMDRTMAEYRVDGSRVYLTGLSQGGHGTWNVAARNVERFAAIAPVCGFVGPFRGDGVEAITSETAAVQELAGRLAGMPVWIFHGEADNVVPASHSTAMHEALKAAGADVKYSLYPGVNHNSWQAAYGEEELPKWLLSHSRGK